MQLPYLGDFAELRKGLFQSVVIAENGKYLRPLLNVDVSHKAFPVQYDSLIYLLQDMEHEYSTQRRRFVVDLTRPLNEETQSKLHAHLVGLELCYCSDGANKRIYKYFELGKVPAKESFEMNRDGRQIATTVEKYFAEELQKPIQYHNLQCIRLGNKRSFISVPMEYCAILSTQVSVVVKFIGSGNEENG